jgi:hypothetical protein
MHKFMTRRNILRGAGVVLAMPVLHSLMPRGVRAQAQGLPKRFIPVYYCNGVPPAWWDGAPPDNSSLFDDGFTLNALTGPLEAVKAKTLIVSRLGNWAFHSAPGGLEPSHSRCCAATLTCVDTDAKGGDSGDSTTNSISADQVIVQNLNLGMVTPIGSMQVGLGSFPGAFDARSYAYNQVVSWKSATEPLKRMVNPKAVFDMMVGAGAMTAAPEQATPDPAAMQAAQLAAARNQSVLDAVIEDAEGLKLRLSKLDQQAMDQFLTSFREVEMQATQVGNILTGGSAGCQVIPEPMVVPEPGGPMQGLNQGEEGYDRQTHANVMNDLIAMAIQCDVTRVISYMLDDARSEFDYNAFIAEEHRTALGGMDFGGASNFHGSAQHGPENNGGYQLITRWFVDTVAKLALKLDAMPEGDGTVLDNTVMLMVNSQHGANHDNNDLPVVLIGSGGGVLKQNGHVAYTLTEASMRHTRDLYYTIQNNVFGANVASFGDHVSGEPNAALTEILA